MDLLTIAEKIWNESEQQGIQCNRNQLPIKIGADCYVFYGTALTQECRLYGSCKEMRYYALTGGSYVRILKDLY